MNKNRWIYASVIISVILLTLIVVYQVFKPFSLAKPVYGKVIELVLSADEPQFLATGEHSPSLKLTAIDENGLKKVITDNYELYNNGEPVLSKPFVTKVTGEHAFSASYGSLTSNVVKVSSIFATHLPIVVIETETEELTKENIASAKIIVYDKEGNKYNSLIDIPTMENDIHINVRGSTSSKMPKKQYAVRLVNETGQSMDRSLLGMPEDNSWILNGPYMDKSLIRNYLVYNVAAEIMEYASRTRYCEVFLKTGKNHKKVSDEDYIGVYVMLERVKRSEYRVDVSKTISYLDESSYIIKRDQVNEKDTLLDTYTARLKDTGNRYSNRLILEFPSVDRISDEKLRYITEDVDQFERRLYSKMFRDPKLGYSPYIDIDSFIDYGIINEFFRNVDGASRSAYYHKEIGGKLKAGPVWDFNFSMGNATYSDAYSTEGFELDGMPWFDQLVQDANFVKQFADRYKRLRKTVLSDKYLFSLIDETLANLGDAVDRNFDRWGEVFEKPIWPNPDDPATQLHEEEIERLKTFISQRGKWMDENILYIGHEKID